MCIRNKTLKCYEKAQNKPKDKIKESQGIFKKRCYSDDTTHGFIINFDSSQKDGIRPIIIHDKLGKKKKTGLLHIVT